MKKIPWYQKIQIQIPVIVFLIILIPAVAFGSYDISASRRSQLQNAKESAGERLYETSLLMQDVMQEIENAGKSLTDSGTFLNLVRTYQDTPADPQTQSSLLLSLGQTGMAMQLYRTNVSYHRRCSISALLQSFHEAD